MQRPPDPPDLIDRQTPRETKTCDSCRHAEPGPGPDKITCFGGPPQCLLVAAREDQFGRLQMKLEMVRPQIALGTRACALHESKIRIATLAAN